MDKTRYKKLIKLLKNYKNIKTEETKEKYINDIIELISILNLDELTIIKLMLETDYYTSDLYTMNQFIDLLKDAMEEAEELFKRMVDE